MKKRIIGLMLAFVLVLTACGQTAQNESQPAKENTSTTEGKEITFMIPDWGAPPQEMLDEFKEESGITVNVETVSWDDIRNKVSIAAGGKTAPADVFEVDWSWVGEFSAAGWLAPLTLDEENKADFKGIDTFTYDGNVVALPYANDFRTGYYNTEMYEKAGLTEPSTWDEVAENSKKIKEQGIAEYPYAIPLGAEENATTSLLWLTFIRDGVVFNEDNTLNKENVMRSLEFMNSMVKDGLVDPANASGSGMDSYRKITDGSTSFMVGPSSFASRVNDPKESSVVGKVQPIVPPGSDSKAKQTMALNEGIGVSAYSENKEAAQKFVEWYTSEATQEKLYAANNTIPTRTSTLTKLVENDTIKNGKVLLETAELVKTVFPNGVPKYYTEMSTAIFNAVNKMALGELTPQQAFEEMNGKVTELAK
ncbi:MAG: sugar ABC transporter substrate-binding protein [Gallicola sp.]|uniref:sugar ABC transporter substrate-binding protein n=1 Tax=Gallicola sp. Sow4_E12 TaxID=3438785 RepID=UPI0017E5BD77|nr:sugar ABC transporter substrate-binding protein [Gallicola sp.]